MDSFEVNKVLGATLGTFLCVVAVHIAAGTIFAPRVPAKPGYVIPVSKESTSPAAPAAKPQPEESIAKLLASADPARGKGDARVCSTCHNFEKGGPNLVGPNLWGVVDRPRASEPGYDYSAAMKAKGGKWNFDELNKFLTNPRGYIAGTKMTFGGFDRASQRADVIAYLRTLSDHPVPLPTATGASSSAPSRKSGATSAPSQSG